jgi:hypothetical protein
MLVGSYFCPVEKLTAVVLSLQNWTDSTSRTVNIDAGLSLSHFGISGKFSSDFQDVKSKQIGDKTVTTRAQLRYFWYG